MLPSGLNASWHKNALGVVDESQEIYLGLLNDQHDHGQVQVLSSSTILTNPKVGDIAGQVMAVSTAASAPLISTKIVVNASGTSAGGVFPHFRVLVDGVKVGEATTGSTAKTYTIDAKVAAGSAHLIQIHYDNDAVINGQDRNLNIALVKIGEKTILPTDSGVTYDRFALDNVDVVAGRSTMPWSGVLNFKLPASAFPAPIPPSFPPQPDPAVKAYYVSTQGRDTWSGKLAAPNADMTDGPVASLGKAAQLARDDSTVDTVIMRGGTYKQASKVTLLTPDSGLKIKAYGNEVPVLDGGGQAQMMMQLVQAKNITITGLTFANGRKDGFAIELNTSDNNRIGDNKFTNVGTAVKLHDASGNAIAGNEMSHLGGFGVEMATGSDNNRVYANHIHHIGENNSQAAGVAGHGSSNNTVAFNDIEYTARYGVSFKDFGTDDAAYNNAVLHNRLLHTNTAGGDTGAIEFLGRSNVMHNHRAEGNYIEDTGGLIKENGIGAAGIYLDDMTNGTTVKGNFIKDTSWTHVMVHGGDKNIIQNNYFVLGAGEKAATVSDNGNIPTGARADGNVIQKNILFGEVSVDQPWWLNNSGVNTVDYNLLYKIAPQQKTDAHSITANPQFHNVAAGDFTLSATSPALSLGIQNLDWAHMGTIGYDAKTAAEYSMPTFWDL
jgi:parallel beta-helix repeat protein